MQRSTLLVPEADPQLLASGHILDERGEVVVSEIFPYNRAHAPSSTLYTNLEELACWAAANCNGCALHGQRILQPETHAAMREPLARISDEEMRTSSGLAWRLTVYRGNLIIHHSGGDTGFTSNLVIAPERRIAAFAMVNSSVGYIPEFVTDAALEVAVG
jgi:CubicO group peptidase (beta-lactamase class C family)